LVGRTVFRIAIGARADAADSADEGSVHQHFQLSRHVRTQGQAARGAHLQVVGGGLFVSVLHGLQESENGTGGCVAAERVGGGRGRSGKLGLLFQEAGHDLSDERRGCQAVQRDANDKKK
jgi:hypothetical protein